MIGFRLPLYFIVSKCEGVPEFLQIASVLPEESRRDVVGWSAPDLHYMDLSWAKEATEYMYSALHKRRDAVFTLSQHPIHKVVHATSSMAQLSKRLQVAIQNIFRPHPGIIVPFVRGVYLCGEYQGSTIFSDKLFKSKVFVERGIAKIIEQEKSQAVRVAKNVARYAVIVFPIVAFLGLTRAAGSLKESCTSLRSNIINLEKCSTSGTVYGPSMLQNALTVLGRAQQIRLFHVWIVSSWWSFLELRIERFYRKIHEKIVLSILDCARTQIRELSSMQHQEAAGVPEDGYKSLEDTGIFKQMQAVVERVTSVEKALTEMSGATTQGYKRAVSCFFPAVKMLENDMPRPIFSARFHDTKYLLSQVIEPEVVAEVWDRLVSRFVTEVLEPDSVTLLRAVVNKLRSFENAADSGSYKKQDLQELACLVSALIAEVDSGELAWLCKDVLFSVHGLREMMSQLAHSHTFGQQLMRDFVAHCESRVRDVRKEFIYSVCIAARSIFSKVENSSEIQVSKRMRQLLGSLNFVLAQDFMQTPEYTPFTVHTYRLAWDSAILQHTLYLLQKYKAFQQEKAAGIKQLPKGAKDVVKYIATQEAVRCAEYGLYKAQEHATDQLPNIKAFISIANNIKANSSCIIEIVSSVYAINTLVAESIANGLREALEGFLHDLKKFLEDGYAYDVHALVECAFDEIRKDGLSNRLFLARNRLVYLVKHFAEPAVSTCDRLHELFPDQKCSDVVAFWKQLLEEVNHYTENHSGGLVDLEKAVVGFAHHNIAPLSVSGDANSYVSKSIALAIKCARDKMQQVCHAEFVKNYTPLAQCFEQRIAGRFPFSVNKNAPMVKDADLVEFYRVYRSVSPQLHKLLDNPMTPGELKRATAEFLRAVERSEYWVGLARMKTRLRLQPTVSGDGDLGKHIARWTLYCDAEKFCPEWKPVMINWSQYHSFAIQIDLASMSKVRFEDGEKRMLLKFQDRWDWVRYITAQAPCTKTRDGGVLHLILPTNHGVMQVDLVMEFLDVNGESIGWPQFPTSAPKIDPVRE